MKIVLACFIIASSVIGCSKDNNNNGNQDATDVFPNKVGGTWVYLVNDTLVNRSSPDSLGVQYNLTVSVVDSIELPGGRKANVWVYAYPAGTDTEYVFQSGDTIRFSSSTDESAFPVYSRQYIIPIALHNSWKYSIPSFLDVTVDTQSDITAGQNHFSNAFHLYGHSGMPDAIFAVDEWLENNVGVVKRHFDPVGMLIDPRHVIAWTLVSYHLK